MQSRTKKIILAILPVIVVFSLIGYAIYCRLSNKPLFGPDEPSGSEKPEFSESDIASPDSFQEAEPPQQQSPVTADAATDAQDTPSPADADLPVSLASVSPDSIWQQLLSKDNFHETAVRILDDIANGLRPLDGLGFLKDGTALPETVVGDDGLRVFTPGTMERFNPFIDFFCSVDPVIAARIYRQQEPALQAALESIGYKEKTIRSLLTEAIAVILSSPDIDFLPALETGGSDGIYYWTDSTVEQLNDAQKLYLRTGPDNGRRIRNQLEAISEELGLFSPAR